MNRMIRLTTTFYMLLLVLVPLKQVFSQESGSKQNWPKGKRVAISLTFDDARTSQVDEGTALLDKYNVKATFYVNPPAVKNRLAGWKKAVGAGHEIGNHSMVHPCSGNFGWSRARALEEYSLKKMRSELMQANDSIYKLLGVRSTAFAYPCGQTFVGRGKGVKSYVPVVSELFISGRLWLSEAPNDPTYCDFAQLTGMEMDGKDFEQILPLIENAGEQGLWLVLAGHEMGSTGNQTTRLSMLEELIRYAQDPANEVWLTTVGEVSRYIQTQQKTTTR